MAADKTTTNGVSSELFKNPTQQDIEQYSAFKGASFNELNGEILIEGGYGQVYDTDRNSSIVTSATPSLINRYALFTYMGLAGDPMQNLAKFYKEQLSNEIMGPTQAKQPTVKNIVSYFAENGGGIEYSYTDFLFCKYWKKVPNNYLLTLRRFASPVEDNIYKNSKLVLNLTDNKASAGTATSTDMTMPDIARAITFMAESVGNKMEDILSFTYGYNWKEHEAETTTHENTSEGYSEHPFYKKLGFAGQAFFDVVRGVDAGEKQRKLHHAGHDPLVETYENFVIGPVNVINKMTTRDRGLHFDQDLKLVFEYQLKEHNGLNPRAIMIDIFANWMVLTFSNANFWGGANRFYNGGGFVASRFGNDELLANGDFTGYIKSVVSDMGSGFMSAFGQQNGDGGFTIDKNSAIKGLKQFGGTILNNMLGGFLNNVMGAPPAYIATKGFITGEATGNWHLTIGNPMNPIAMMGNLVLKDSTVTFGGGLGADDFPNEMRCEVILSHARPRDKTDIESMFNAGKGRLYAAANDFADVLNLEGLDVDVYGAFQFDLNGKNKSGENANRANLEDYEKLSELFKDGKSSTIKGGKQFSKWANSSKSKYISDHANSLIHV